MTTSIPRTESGPVTFGKGGKYGISTRKMAVDWITYYANLDTDGRSTYPKDEVLRELRHEKVELNKSLWLTFKEHRGSIQEIIHFIRNKIRIINPSDTPDVDTYTTFDNKKPEPFPEEDTEYYKRDDVLGYVRDDSGVASQPIYDIIHGAAVKHKKEMNDQIHAHAPVLLILITMCAPYQTKPITFRYYTSVESIPAFFENLMAWVRGMVGVSSETLDDLLAKKYSPKDNSLGVSKIIYQLISLTELLVAVDIFVVGKGRSWRYTDALYQNNLDAIDNALTSRRCLNIDATDPFVPSSNKGGFDSKYRDEMINLLKKKLDELENFRTNDVKENYQDFIDRLIKLT